ncbi:MAG: glycosyltransferase [Parasporobacterium sp.]|nr:glycosyltransferase [Parasporobacterium sp.]
MVSSANSNLISIIVPVYKVPQYLDRCVESIIGQTYDNLEIILVDDGSPDNCPAMCDSWAGKDSRIRVVHKENGGLSDARNAGLEIAAGELIGFVDSDDWIAPEMYERLKKALDNDQSDIAACTVEMVWKDGTPDSILTVRENCVLERIEAQLALMKETKLKQPVWYKLYRKSVVAGIPFEKGKLHEDVYWSYQVVGNAKRVSVIDYVGYFYWQRSGSIMGNNYSLKRLDSIEAIERRYKYIAREFPELEKTAKRSIIENCIYHGQMALKYLSKEEQEQAFKYLNEVKDRYPLKKEDYSEEKYTHRMWIDIAKKSLLRACRIRNRLGVGD